MRGLVTGATGFIGRRLLRRLDRPVVLSRDAARAQPALSGFGATVFSWNADTEPPPREAFDGVEAVFHLAGEPVGDGRWTAAKKQRIRDSRILGTRRLVDALAELDARPRVLVSASAVGYYGVHGDNPIDESTPPGDDFLAGVCVGWEREAARARELGIRVVHVRIGVVLGRDGGAMAKMLLPFRMGVGGRLANGRQWMPWVHVDDVAGIFLHAAQCDDASGPANATAPTSATNAEFTRALGRALGRPTLLPMPAFALRLLFGEFADIMIASQRVLPRSAERWGYRFAYPDLDSALGEIVVPAKRPS